MTRTSATGPDRRGRRAGFTLTELLLVTAIIGLAGAAVVVTAAPPGDRGASADAEAFAAALGRARDEAVLANQTVELVASGEGYAYERVTMRGREPLSDLTFRETAWSDKVRPQIPDGEETQRFRFDPTGAAEPRTLTLRDERRAVQVSVDEAGQVAIDAATR